MSPLSTPIIYDYQRPAFEKLLAIATACFSVQRHTLPLRLRPQTLIVGPSGCGKTHLAQTVGRELDASYLGLSVAEWILLGCSNRGGTTTWQLIYDFLWRNRNAAGLIILVDELDKVAGSGAWEVFLRTEAYSLLDFRLPVALVDSEGDPIPKTRLDEAQEVLANRTLILGTGAFQDFWEANSRAQVGFGNTECPVSAPDANLLSTMLDREFINRFRSDIIVLPQLQENDYRRMLEQTAIHVPHYLRTSFVAIGNARIKEAVRLRQGGRFVEEVLLDAVLYERAMLKHLPETSVGKKIVLSPLTN